eukprot:15470192-Alexandrium_andersonii.AAC.1
MASLASRCLEAPTVRKQTAHGRESRSLPRFQSVSCFPSIQSKAPAVPGSSHASASFHRFVSMHSRARSNGNCKPQ